MSRWTVFSHVIRGCPRGLLQVHDLEAVRYECIKMCRPTSRWVFTLVKKVVVRAVENGAC